MQIGRSTESPIDFVVTDTVAGGQEGEETPITQSTISRFACRVVCERGPPFTARIYAAGFDSSKNIFLGVIAVQRAAIDLWRLHLGCRLNRGWLSTPRLFKSTRFHQRKEVKIWLWFCSQEKAAKWKNPDGHMDGLTTNGVLVMHPKGGFTEESKPGVWREISVCGDVYTLRETRSAQTPGKLVGGPRGQALAATWLGLIHGP